jgi:hypothetical protein
VDICRRGEVGSGNRGRPPAIALHLSRPDAGSSAPEATATFTARHPPEAGTGPARRRPSTSPPPRGPSRGPDGSRSPGALVPPARMESVDRWPLASVSRQIPGGRSTAGAAVRRRVCGRHPPPEGRMPQSQSPPLPGVPGLCGGPVPGGLSGGNRMAGWCRRGTPRRRPGRVLAHPNLLCTELCPPPRGGGCRPCGTSRPFGSRAGPGRSK